MLQYQGMHQPEKRNKYWLQVRFRGFNILLIEAYTLLFSVFKHDLMQVIAYHTQDAAASNNGRVNQHRSSVKNSWSL